ncbi:C39 family peptidase [Fictibacillus phosphorivorans]|uniref:C39 family peptidase n=1 Tax=Fictibacillus phosphorivorans TaxID=1221500 RepID=UPI003CE9CE6C
MKYRNLCIYFIVFLIVGTILQLDIRNTHAATNKNQAYMVVSSSVIIRSGPTDSKSKIVTVDRGTILYMIQKHTTLQKQLWYKVKTVGGKQGWVHSKNLQLLKRKVLNAPLIAQMPELPRGCEVTSLAMLLRYSGIKADKMTLAKQVKKDSTPYRKVNGKVYFGNPYNGFVGDMYTFNKPGYGVYHGPIAELAKKYLGMERVTDLTGKEFDSVLEAINKGTPVWVVANTHFKKLSSSYFQEWYTPTGKVSITYKEHSVLVTGYDNLYVYFNDPLKKVKNRRVLKTDFKAAWIQMGKQAVTYIK